MTIRLGDKRILREEWLTNKRKLCYRKILKTMKRKIFIYTFLFILLNFSWTLAHAGTKVLLLIAEQNIGEHYYYWWGGAIAEEVNLSLVESILAQSLTKAGFEVIDPSVMGKLKVKKPYQHLGLNANEAVELARSYGANLVVLGKALATEGAKLSGTTMVSSSANITAKVVRVKDRKIISYLSASGDSVHPNVVSAGNEALEQAAEELAEKLINELQITGEEK